MLRIALLAACMHCVMLAQSQTVLFECGQNSGKNFNGWMISPYALFDAIEFDANSTSFYSQNGGNFSVSLTKKIDELSQFQDLDVLFNFDIVNNANIDHVVYFTSADGKNWNAVENSRNNTSVRVNNDSLAIRFVRAEVSATFFNDGKITCDYVKIEGDRKFEAATADLDELEIAEDKFYIFNNAHTVNIETAIDGPYQLLITGINGQIVFRENFEGSQRIQLPEALRGFYIVTIIQNNVFQATKKIVIG